MLPLPLKGFRWASTDEMKLLETVFKSKKNISLTSFFGANKGFFLQCNLKYPKELHSLHNDLPLAPVKTVIKKHMLSPIQKLDFEYMKKTDNFSSKKLLTTLFNKEDYTLHYKNLKLYLALGLELTKITKVLVFEEADYMR